MLGVLLVAVLLLYHSTNCTTVTVAVLYCSTSCIVLLVLELYWRTGHPNIISPTCDNQDYANCKRTDLSAMTFSVLVDLRSRGKR